MMTQLIDFTKEFANMTTIHIVVFCLIIVCMCTLILFILDYMAKIAMLIVNAFVKIRTIRIIAKHITAHTPDALQDLLKDSANKPT